MREVLTIQTGAYANLIGAHFWNLQASQESWDGAYLEKLFSRSSGLGGIAIYYPRVLIFDDGSQLTVPEAAVSRAHLDKEATTLAWDGHIDIVQRQDGPSSTSMVSAGMAMVPCTWREILNVPVRPSSICVNRNRASASDADDRPAVWEEDKEGDCLRTLLEDCDAVQGLHVLMDMSRAASSTGVASVQAFRDEAASAGIACFCYDSSQLGSGSRTGPGAVAEARRAVDLAVALEGLVEAGACVVPLDPQAGLSSSTTRTTRQQAAAGIQNSHGYHSSGVHAAVLDVVTGMYRGAPYEEARCLMRTWIDGICLGGVSVTSLEAAVPFSADLTCAQQQPGEQASIEEEGKERRLHALFKPQGSDPRSEASGLLSYLTPLCPSPLLDSARLRRYSNALTIRGLPVPAPRVEEAMNAVAKYHPWFNPALTYASRHPLPLRKRLIPTRLNECQRSGEGCVLEEHIGMRPKIRDTGRAGGGGGAAGDVDDDDTGDAVMTSIGCSTRVVPYLHSVAEGLTGRSVAIRERLAATGVGDEDLMTTEETLVRLLEQLEDST